MDGVYLDVKSGKRLVISRRAILLDRCCDVLEVFSWLVLFLPKGLRLWKLILFSAILLLNILLYLFVTRKARCPHCGYPGRGMLVWWKVTLRGDAIRCPNCGISLKLVK
ncbi:hypothetical protein [Dysosmobacter sp.]|uniref:hypothetical protein n=1 Tax=Dysosmobacter sp. TaxID=2591382 RepID=UPI002A8A1367|nr:hypothetical protein [Dysosmobacter sp.]MDY3984178.1 hypothetical protein [Dysosmobacter sp.]